jgi:thiol-disulfide isomerase/thioredoxin
MSRLLAPCLIAVCPIALACIPRLSSDSGTSGDWDWVAPDNSWGVSAPPEGTVGVGFQDGQIVPDARLVDQFGDEVSLWQFYGQVILLDVSTMWCAPCQELGKHTDETWLEYRDQGFIYLTVLQEDVESNPPDAADIQFWVDEFGITSPVLGDGDKQTLGAIQQGQYPAVLIIDRELRVKEHVSPPEDGVVRTAIEAAL